MDDTHKKDEDHDRRDRPSVRFETVVEEPEAAEVPEQHQKLELPHQLPPEMPQSEPEAVTPEKPEMVQEEVQIEAEQAPETKDEEQVQGSRFDDLARALGGGAVEAGTTIGNKRTGGKRFSWGWVAFLLIFIFGSGLGMAGGYAMWGKQFEIRNLPADDSASDMPLFPQNTPKVTGSTPATITATPKVSADRSQMVLQVLNGSGAVGAASDIKSFLEGLGYKNVAAGNANRSDYEDTKISIKDSKQALLLMLTADLSKQVSVSTEASTLSETSSYDAIVTLGKK